MSKKKVLTKVVILGDTGVGKTALIHKYTEGKFIEEHKATIGVDFLTKEIEVDDKLVTLQIWDTAGQERFQSMGTAFYRGSDACLLVYDITLKESFDEIDTWRKSFLEHADPENSDDFPFLLLGNKVDLNEQRQVSTSEGEKYASNNNNMLFYETSALTGTEIENAIKAIASKASVIEPICCPVDLSKSISGYDTNNYGNNTSCIQSCSIV